MLHAPSLVCIFPQENAWSPQRAHLNHSRTPKDPKSAPRTPKGSFQDPWRSPGGPAGNDRLSSTFLEFYNVLTLQAPPRIPRGVAFKDATRSLQGPPRTPNNPSPQVPQGPPETPPGPPRSAPTTPKAPPRPSQDPYFLIFYDLRTPKLGLVGSACGLQY